MAPRQDLPGPCTRAGPGATLVADVRPSAGGADMLASVVTGVDGSAGSPAAAAWAAREAVRRDRPLRLVPAWDGRPRRREREIANVAQRNLGIYCARRRNAYAPRAQKSGSATCSRRERPSTPCWSSSSPSRRPGCGTRGCGPCTPGSPRPVGLGPGDVGAVNDRPRGEEWLGLPTAVLQVWRDKYRDVEVLRRWWRTRPRPRSSGPRPERAASSSGTASPNGRSALARGPVTHAAIHHTGCPVAVAPHL